MQYYADAANSQIYHGHRAAAALGFSLKDVAAFLETQEYYAAAFTEDEVRAAQSRLPSVKEVRPRRRQNVSLEWQYVRPRAPWPCHCVVR